MSRRPIEHAPVAAALLVLLAALPAPAVAGTASSSVSLGPLAIVLNPLASAGPTSVDWALGFEQPTFHNLSRIEVQAADYTGAVLPPVSWDGPFVVRGQTAGPNPEAFASAEVAGGGSAAGTSFAASGWAATDCCVAWYGAGVNGPYTGYGAWFTLSPQTELVLTAPATLLAQAQGVDQLSNAASQAFAQAWISFTGPAANGGGGSQSALEQTFLSGTATPGAAYGQSANPTLEIRFLNQTDAAMDARFEWGIYASGQAVVNQVPEPGTGIMLLAGLGLGARFARRRMPG